MKKIILGFLASLALLVVPSVSFGQHNTEAIDAAVAVAVDKFEDVRLSLLNDAAQVQLLKDIIGAIDVLKQQDRYVDGGLYAEVIDSLRRALVDMLDDAIVALGSNSNNNDTTTTNGSTTTTTTTTNTTHGFPDTTTTFQSINDLPVLVVGGNYSDEITNFRMTAAGEDILLKEITIIINGSANAYQALDSIALYDDEGTFIAQKNVSSDEVTFSAMDLLIPVGSFNIYPLIKTRDIGYGEAGIANAQFTLTLRIDDTEGMSSGQPVGVTNNYVSSKLVVITPVLVSVAMEEKTGILQLTKTDIAEFSVSSVGHNNTTQAAPGSDLDTILEQLQFRVAAGNIDTVTPPTFILSRNNPVNSSTNDLVGSWDPLMDLLTFDLSSWADHNGIIDGTVDFTVSVENIVELNASNDTNILLTLEAGNDQAIIFGTDDFGYGLFSVPLEQDYAAGWKTKNN